MNAQFCATAYFDLSNFPWKDIFSTKEQVWEVIAHLPEYIPHLFKMGVVKGNYSENVFLGENSVIEPGAIIKGPTIIGKNCVIGHTSLIREYCLLGDNVHIGHAVEVKQTVFLNDAKAAHFNYIGNSIIGSGVNISAGAVLANFRLDRKKVLIKHNNQRIETGLEKFGSIVGDDTTIGVNAVLNPGTILGKKTIVYPLINVMGVHPANEVIR